MVISLDGGGVIRRSRLTSTSTEGATLFLHRSAKRWIDDQDGSNILAKRTPPHPVISQDFSTLGQNASIQGARIYWSPNFPTDLSSHSLQSAPLSRRIHLAQSLPQLLYHPQPPLPPAWTANFLTFPMPPKAAAKGGAPPAKEGAAPIPDPERPTVHYPAYTVTIRYGEDAKVTLSSDVWCVILMDAIRKSYVSYSKL
jgi:hypothetical protein